MSLLLVTGVSGAGKSAAIDVLEDLGYFCVDNLPASLISKFIDFYQQGDENTKNVVLVADVRAYKSKTEIKKTLDVVKDSEVNGKILFLDAKNETIERRYKESKRVHPLSQKNKISTEDALKKEREILSPLYTNADYIMDTSVLSVIQFKDRIVNMFKKEENSSMAINIMSFGFKFGSPKDADIVLDVRCLENPYYIEELKNKTGLDSEVFDYVFSFNDSQKLFSYQKEMLEFSLPLYIKEGKRQITIAFGCTGGKHRSVSFAEKLAIDLKDKNYSPSISHRDITRK